ncbi:MAG: type IV toxin-antitoxin system AbiEi family antitoxin domain-containing protein [Deltaproteobacteria bacterium]|nr:type IV toxin-antitoxin system AbiEi family antitoxin domain-containing protein [Deltaproteobacteria bacterium]
MAGPDWDKLYVLAEVQQGYFTARQAQDASYSPQLLQKYLRSKRIARVRRGIYRLIHHPAGDQEELIVLWLWSEQVGVFSHETALSLHRISDVLPSRFHLTLPLAWKKRRLRVPDRVTPYYENLLKPERTWVGAVPVTTVARTLSDCLDANVTTDTIRAAVRDVSRRGLLGPTEVQVFLDELDRMEGKP